MDPARPRAKHEPHVDGTWHQPLTVVAALVAGWNLIVAWTGLSMTTAAPPSSEVQSAQIHILLSVVGFALLALVIGLRNAKAGGSTVAYGVAALLAMAVGSAALIATAGLVVGA